MTSDRKKFFPANAKNARRKTVGELVLFLLKLPPETLIGVWCHEDDGADLLDGHRISLTGYEYRVYDDMRPDSHGRAWLLANVQVERKEPDEE